MPDGHDRHSGDAVVGTLPDCFNPCPAAMLRLMSKRIFPALLLASASLAACTHVETAGGPPPLPQVTAAAAVSRPFTEWDEFTGRLGPVQSVGVRPRVSGPFSCLCFDEGRIAPPGPELFPPADR